MWNGTDSEIEVLWIRHGMTKANKEHRYLGKTDEALSTEGKKALLAQWKTKTDLLSSVDKIYCSPMKRCVETAELLFPQNQDYQVISQWQEMDFGRFEYRNYKELNGDPDYQAWIDSGGTLPFPEGESRDEFIQRSMEGWKSVCSELRAEQQLGHPIRRICCIVHGGTIMAVLSTLLGGDYYDYQIGNGEMKFIK